MRMHVFKVIVCVIELYSHKLDNMVDYDEVRHSLFWDFDTIIMTIESEYRIISICCRVYCKKA